jgi:hypothetical protein
MAFMRPESPALLSGIVWDSFPLCEVVGGGPHDHFDSMVEGVAARKFPGVYIRLSIPVEGLPKSDPWESLLLSVLTLYADAPRPILLFPVPQERVRSLPGLVNDCYAIHLGLTALVQEGVACLPSAAAPLPTTLFTRKTPPEFTISSGHMFNLLHWLSGSLLGCLTALGEEVPNIRPGVLFGQKDMSVMRLLHQPTASVRRREDSPELGSLRFLPHILCMCNSISHLAATSCLLSVSHPLVCSNSGACCGAGDSDASDQDSDQDAAMEAASPNAPQIDEALANLRQYQFASNKVPLTNPFSDSESRLIAPGTVELRHQSAVPWALPDMSLYSLTGCSVVVREGMKVLRGPEDSDPNETAQRVFLSLLPL